MAVMLIGTSAGCSSSGSLPSPRTHVRGDAVTVVVQGAGVVNGGVIECGLEADSCRAEFDELWSTELVATPEPGWTFRGWRRTVKNQRLSPSSGLQGEIVVQTAVFERQEQVARRRRNGL